MSMRSQLSPNFQRLAWSNLTAQMAEQVALAAAPIVAVLVFSAGVGQTGLLQMALTLPFLLFAIPAGLLADRMPRRNLMAAAEAIRAVALLAILGFIQLGILTWPLLALFGFVAVCGTVAFSVAAPALVPALVPTSALPTANARIELARTTAFAAGPAIGGVLVGWIGAEMAFGLAAALSGGAAFLLRGIDEPHRSTVTGRRPLQEIREGAVFVLRHPLLAPVFLTQFVFNTAFFIILAVFVPHAIHNLGLSPSGVGFTLGMFGVGMVIGALLAPRIIALMAFGTVVAAGPCAGVIASALMALTIWWPTPVFAALSFFLLGLGPILWIISTTTLRQRVTPNELLGRVSAINIMAYGARPIGSAIGALVGALYGIEACFIVAFAAFVAQAMLIICSPVVRLRNQPEMKQAPLPAPCIA